MIVRKSQQLLFADMASEVRVSDEASSSFVGNMSLPVHRWFRYSAGFSAEWVERVIAQALEVGPVQVFDPFAGSATTLIAAEKLGVPCWGIDAHPFVGRVARAKLAWRSDPDAFLAIAERVRRTAESLTPRIDSYPLLIGRCYTPETLAHLDVLRQSFELSNDDSPASALVWLALISILRKTSHAGTAQWQYVLPRKQKRSPQNPELAFADACRTMYEDMLRGQGLHGPPARFDEGDARTCANVPSGFANLVVTSPPYPNNYDYADATRLEMTFLREVESWGDLQQAVRRRLVRSCSQHVPERTIDLEEVLGSEELDPIRGELSPIVARLADVRQTKGGKKTYHLMVACYFRDLAQVWHSLRRVCRPGARVCFVVGDSAPYGVYVPVMPWLGALARAAGFGDFRFERTRDRNVKWKNRKHRVPLQEGRLWVDG